MAKIINEVLSACQKLGVGAHFDYGDIKTKYTRRQVMGACGNLLKKDVIRKHKDGKMSVRIREVSKMHKNAIFLHEGRTWLAERTHETNCILIKSCDLHRKKAFKATKLDDGSFTSVGYTRVSSIDYSEMFKVYKSFSKNNQI